MELAGATTPTLPERIRALRTQLQSTLPGLAARAAIDGAVATADRGLDAMGRAFMQFWHSPAQRVAPKLTSYVANLSDHTSAAIATAIAALDELLAPSRAAA